MEGQSNSVPARSDTERAVALAKLLHHECEELLNLYKERKSVLSENLSDSERLVTFTLCSEDLTATEQVRRCHSALKQCLELLECLIRRGSGEGQEEMEGEYESTRNVVKDRIGYLLHIVERLLESSEGGCTPSSEIQCVQDLDESPGSSAAKLWTYRVLLELIHWSSLSSRALYLLHSERQSE